MSNVAAARSFHFKAASSGPPAPKTAASLSLTASDGTGLTLISLSANVVLSGPLAFTELHLVFQNPEPRQLEGRFQITLPDGAAISRFAMRVGQHFQEGEVVLRQVARRVYEDFLHHRQDPALLEHEAGNEFSGRVFPIEANSQKEIIVSYGQELVAATDVYRLPLLGLPEIQRLHIRALLGTGPSGPKVTSSLDGSAETLRVVEVEKVGWTPDIDFEVAPLIEKGGSGALQQFGLRNENLVVVRVMPEVATAPDEIDSLLVLFDRSASRALGFEAQVDLLCTLCQGLADGRGPETPLLVACFDQSVEVFFEGTAGDFNTKHRNLLVDGLALGASDLSGALTWAAQRKGTMYDRMLLVTDGVATAGETDADKVVAAARALAEAGVKRLDALSAGGIVDSATLRRLVTSGLPGDGTVIQSSLPQDEIARRLVSRTRSGIKVSVQGASWVWPSRLDGVLSGDSVLIYADIPANLPVKVLLDEQSALPDNVELGAASRPFLERAWIKARIARLEELRANPETDPDVRSGLEKQIADLSVKHRVLSPYTALLVLETERDYEQYGIDRNALSDILTVGVSGIEVLRRTGPHVPIRTMDVPIQSEVSSLKKSKGRPPPDGSAAPADLGRSEPEAPAFAHDDGVSDVMEGGAEGEVDLMTFVPMSGTLTGGHNPDVDLLRSLRSDVRGPAAPPPPPGFAASPDFADESSFAEVAPAASAPMMAAPMMGARMASAPMAPTMSMPAARPAPGPAEVTSMPMSPEPDDAVLTPPRASPLRRIANVVASVFRPEPEPPAPPPPAPPPPAPPRPRPPLGGPSGAPPPQPPPDPSPLESWTGKFRDVMALVLAGKGEQALDMALSWLISSPGNVLALVAIGEAAELLHNVTLAERAYGSLIDLFPSRADLRRFAGELLSRLKSERALHVAIDTYKKAVVSRPDHPSGHRLLGMALLRAGRPAEAYEAISVGQARTYPSKFPGIPRILAEDLGLCAAAWIRAEPSRKNEILMRVSQANGTIESEPSVRFVLVWETDANDVDFHIHDAAGGHAYYSQKELPSGGVLYADVTQGYGPECFTIRGPASRRSYPYALKAHYYSQGPMGFGMGALQIIEHDGDGRFSFEERPYVVMVDRAFVSLGNVHAALPFQE